MLVRKGDSVHVCWLDCRPAALSGMQLKMGATLNEFSGVVKHVRGDDPENPTQVRLFVDPNLDANVDHLPRVRPPGCTCEHLHVEIKPAWVTEIL